MSTRTALLHDGSGHSRWRRRLAVLIALAFGMLATVATQSAQAAVPLDAFAVSAGFAHTCAIKASDSTLVCFGNDDSGQTNVPSGLGAVTAVAAGQLHTCAIKASDSTLVCFGNDESGQTDVPAGLAAVSAVSAGDVHTCAIKASDSTLVCFGNDDSGETDVPAGLGAVTAVSAGAFHTCAITAADGTLVCFGFDGYGETNVPSGLGEVSAISAGAFHTCAITAADGTLVCFGYDGYGETNVPSGLGEVTVVAAGGYHTCAITAADGTVVCFGDDNNGQTNVPSGLGEVTAVAAGEFHTCAVKAADSTMVCWGFDGNGQTDVPAGLGAVGFGPSTSAPGAPEITGTSAGDGQVAVIFLAPTSDGGAAITSYTVTASPGGQTCTVTLPAALSCTVTGLADGTAYTFTVTATNGVGTGDASAASGAVTPVGSQAITFTSTPPANAIVGTPYTVTATGGASGNPVTFTTDARSTGCTVNATTGVVAFTAIGKCLIDAHQAASTGYTAAPTVQQKILVHNTPQTITLTSTPPAHVIPGTAYTITATGGGSGNPVQFNRGQTPTSICTVTTTGVLTFTGPGQCKITATQGGNTTYAPAPAAKQVIIVNRK